MMKTISITVFCVLCCIIANGQNWLWAKAYGTGASGSLDPIQLVVDQAGNIIQAGVYSGTTTIGTKTISNSGYAGPFIAKYDNNGNLLWVSPSKNSNIETWVFSLIADKAGSAYMTGEFKDTLSFDSIKIVSANYNMFMVKYNTNGSPIWAYSPALGKASGAGTEFITTGPNNSIYMAGKFTDTIVIGNDSLKDGGYNGGMFVARFDTSGHPIWAKEAIVRRGSSSMGGLAVTADPYGNAYVYGTFFDTIWFGKTRITALYSNPNYFLAKYDSMGNLRFVKTGTLLTANSSVDNNDAFYGPMTSDAAGNIYIARLYFGSMKFGSTTLTANPYNNMYLVKLDTACNVIWAKNSSCPSWASYIIPYSFSVDNTGHIYLSGTLQDSATINGMFFKADSAQASFIQKLDTNGNAICGTVVNNNNDDENPVAANILGNDVFFSGDVENLYLNYSYCNFGNDTIKGTGIEWGFLADWTCGTLMADETSADNRFDIYPNPSQGLFTLQFKIDLRDSRIELYNTMGELLAAEQFSGKQTNIDLRNYQNGVYIIKVSSGKEVYYNRLVKIN